MAAPGLRARLPPKAIDAVLVFLHLLEANSKGGAEVGLAHPEHPSEPADPNAHMLISGVRGLHWHNRNLPSERLGKQSNVSKCLGCRKYCFQAKSFITIGHRRSSRQITPSFVVQFIHKKIVSAKWLRKVLHTIPLGELLGDAGVQFR
jgi:hypothetical protein